MYQGGSYFAFLKILKIALHLLKHMYSGHSGFLALKLYWDCFLPLLLALIKYFSSSVCYRDYRMFKLIILGTYFVNDTSESMHLPKVQSRFAFPKVVGTGY